MVKISQHDMQMNMVWNKPKATQGEKFKSGQMIQSDSKCMQK